MLYQHGLGVDTETHRRAFVHSSSELELGQASNGQLEGFASHHFASGPSAIILLPSAPTPLVPDLTVTI